MPRNKILIISLIEYCAMDRTHYDVSYHYLTTMTRALCQDYTAAKPEHWQSILFLS